MLYCINNIRRKDNTARSKAPVDISEIAKSCGASEIVFYEPEQHKNLNVTRFLALFAGIRNWMRLYRKIQKGDIVILQHPNENILVANKMIDICKKKKNICFIALVHDLMSLRKMVVAENTETLDKRNYLADDVVLKKCQYVICHNEKMHAYLLSRGFDEKQLLDLEIFDYLHECKLPETRKLEKSVVIAGNLMKSKSSYLYKYIDSENRDVCVHLFGPNFERTADDNSVICHGNLKPEELPGKIEGAFGLVWDGIDIDTCSGGTGQYLKYNNPHKTSLYLSAGLPVIIWKEAAMADFIEKNGVGITVSSLNEIGQVLDSISEESYQTMVANARKMGEKLRAGYYTKTAVEKCLMRLGI